MDLLGGLGGYILDTDNPSEQVQKLEDIFHSKLERCLPQKTVRINRNIDKPYITEKIGQEIKKGVQETPSVREIFITQKII